MKMLGISGGNTILNTGGILVLGPELSHFLCISGLLHLKDEFTSIPKHLNNCKLEIQWRAKGQMACLCPERAQGGSSCGALIKYINGMMSLGTGAPVSHLGKCC